MTRKSSSKMTTTSESYSLSLIGERTVGLDSGVLRRDLTWISSPPGAFTSQPFWLKEARSPP